MSSGWNALRQACRRLPRRASTRLMARSVTSLYTACSFRKSSEDDPTRPGLFVLFGFFMPPHEHIQLAAAKAGVGSRPDRRSQFKNLIPNVLSWRQTTSQR